MGNQVVITEPVQKLVVIQPVSEEALSALSIAEKNELRDIAKHEMMLIGKPGFGAQADHLQTWGRDD